MKNNRPIAELLQILLDNIELIDRITHKGLCGLNFRLYTIGEISSEEQTILEMFIDNNKPRIFHKHYHLFVDNSSYYWNMGEKVPRIKWLKYHILKTKK